MTRVVPADLDITVAGVRYRLSAGLYRGTTPWNGPDPDELSDIDVRAGGPCGASVDYDEFLRVYGDEHGLDLDAADEQIVGMMASEGRRR